MVLENFLKSKSINSHSLLICFLSFVYVFIAYLVSYYFFSGFLSLAILFTLTLMVVPSMNTILSLDEKTDIKSGIKHFMRNHRVVFKVYFFSFIGFFLGFLLLGSIFGYEPFSYQLDLLKDQRGLSAGLIEGFKNFEGNPGFENFVGVFSTNLYVMLICFVLSLYFGAGAIFLVTLNASVFAVFISYVINYASKSFVHGLSIFGITLIYFIPEIVGFLLAAVAGGVLSRLIVTKDYKKIDAGKVVQNVFVKLCLGILLILVAAFIEVYISYGWMKMII